MFKVSYIKYKFYYKLKNKILDIYLSFNFL